MIKYIWTLWHDPDFKSSVFQPNGQIIVFFWPLFLFPSDIQPLTTNEIQTASTNLQQGRALKQSDR